MRVENLVIAGIALLLSAPVFSDVEIVNLDHGDTVSGKHFTVVAKGENYLDCEALQLSFTVSNDDGQKALYLDAGGIVSDPDLSLVNEVSANIICSPRHPFTMVFKVEGYGDADELVITVKIMDSEGFVAHSQRQVRTK